MDISKAIIAKSDQLNAADLVGPVHVTIVDVVPGPADQPVHIVTDVYGPGRPFKPSKTVLRDLGGAWGLETGTWVGRRMEIYNDPEVLWAGKKVGGIRVSGLSDITKPIQARHVITRGQQKEVTIRPLPVQTVTATEGATEQWHVDMLGQASTIPELQKLWEAATKDGAGANPRVIAAKDARKQALLEPGSA